MYSVAVTVAANLLSYLPAEDSSVRLVFDRSDLYGPELADDDVIAAGDGSMDSDHAGPYYEQKGNTLVLTLECRRGAKMSYPKVCEALSHALSAIGVEKRAHSSLINDVTQSCRARAGDWIAPAAVLVKVDHRLRGGGPAASQSAAPLPRKRKAVLPPSESTEALPRKTRRRFVNGAAGKLLVVNLAPEFDRVAAEADRKQKRALLRWIYGRRVAAGPTAPPLPILSSSA